MVTHENQPVVERGVPLGSGAGVAIMVHGRGAAPANILELAPRLGRDDFTYLAPTAAGRTWYPYSFMTERERNEPALSSALGTLDRVIARALERGVPRERVLLLGFSQGACLVSEFAASHAARYGGVILFSGGLIGPPGTMWNYDGAFDGTPVFLGCSDVDAHVPRERVEETAAVFTRMGASVDLRIYPGMGHLVNDDEITAARDLAAALAP